MSPIRVCPGAAFTRKGQNQDGVPRVQPHYITKVDLLFESGMGGVVCACVCWCVRSPDT